MDVCVGLDAGGHRQAGFGLCMSGADAVRVRQQPMRRGITSPMVRDAIAGVAGKVGKALVELRGFEPLTSAVRLQRSPI
jgi:hypothetical protein